MSNEKERRAAENRIVAEKLIMYPIMASEYQEAVYSVAYEQGHNHSGIHAGIGDPTASRAIKLADATRELRAWLECVEAAKSVYSERQRLLLSVRQRFCPVSSGGRPAWVEYARTVIGQETGKCLNPVTIKKIWLDMVDVCVRVALRKKLL